MNLSSIAKFVKLLIFSSLNCMLFCICATVRATVKKYRIKSKMEFLKINYHMNLKKNRTLYSTFADNFAKC